MDMTNKFLLLPKTGKKKKTRRNPRAFQRLIISLDRKCMNGRCEWWNIEALVAHHIIFRAHGGGDTEENGITLCRVCHNLVHGIGTKDKTGDQEMRQILEHWLSTPEWRWDEAYKWIQKRSHEQNLL